LDYGKAFQGGNSDKVIATTKRWVGLAAEIGAPVMRTQVVGMTRAGLMPRDQVIDAVVPPLSKRERWG
jgi:hypothetical protein